MRFSELLAGLAVARAAEGADPTIRGLCYDSRAVRSGDLFIALRGAVADGHAHTGEAARLGAVALLLEDASGAPPLPHALVTDTRRALAPLAARFFGHPARELSLIGITGTNGKTSTGFLVESMLRAAGRRPGLVGTVAVRYAQVNERALNTTPESLDLQRTLRAMRESAVTDVVMEVSSHGLALGRVEGCEFRVAAFSNLSQDHLDFHDDMDAYRAAKLLLFERYLARGGDAVVNADDAAAAAFEDAARRRGARLWRVTRDPNARAAEVRLLASETRLHGTRARFSLQGEELEVRMPLIGDFNIENALLACGVARALGLPVGAIARGLEACPPVPGRLERVRVADAALAEHMGAAPSRATGVASAEGARATGVALADHMGAAQGAAPSRVADEEEDTSARPSVFVDYAHTPDALFKLLFALRPLCKRRLVAVFGCGGDRDRGKRPLMARAAARWCDFIVVTSDNPRREDPERILDDVVAGFAGLAEVLPADAAAGVTQKCFTRISDRRAAIALAIAVATADDVVVIAGKGHEDYQIVGHERLPFDDRSEAQHALAAWQPA